MNDIEKLRIMLPHWIEHNKSHSDEFKKWAEKIKNAGETELASLLVKAINGLTEADMALSTALEKLGGPAEGAEGHHHHDHDHEHHGH